MFLPEESGVAPRGNRLVGPGSCKWPELLVEDCVETTMGCQLQAESELNILDHDYYRIPCFVKMCRICFATDCKMYLMTSFTVLNEAYETLCGIMTADEEHLPRYLCTECTDRLMNCARFKRRSLRAHSVLLDIFKRHGRVTAELVYSFIRSHNQLSNDSIPNTNEDHCGHDNKELEEVNELTDRQCDTPKDVYEYINDIKAEINNVNDSSHINSEDVPNDVTVGIKMENDDLNNQEDLNSCSYNVEEDIVGSDVAAVDYDMVKQDNHGDSPCNSDEDIVIDDIIAQNDMINRDDVSVCSFSVEDTGDDTVDNININDEAACNRLVYPTLLYEEIISNVLNMVKVRNPKVPSSGGYMERRHSFIFVGVDVLDDRLSAREVGLEAELDNTIKMDKQQPAAGGGPSADVTFRCDICPYRTDVDIKLLEHLKAHAEFNKSFQCDVCGHKTKHKGSFVDHMRTHSGGEQHTCDICKKVFKHKRSVRVHLNIHSGEKPYSCIVCSKMFRQKSILRVHSAIHTGEKYSCPVCFKVFRHSGSLRYHSTIHAREKLYSCEICKKTFTTKNRSRKHLKQHSNEKPYSCDICKKVFRVKRTLRRHLLTHSVKKPYSCNICKKAFNIKSYLQRHLLLTHPDEKPFSCDVCKKEFKSKYLLQLHLKVHLSEKSYSCDICKKIFNRKYNLQAHIKSHLNPETYSCEICKKVYSLKGNLRRHLGTHAADELYCDEVLQDDWSDDETLPLQ